MPTKQETKLTAHEPAFNAAVLPAFWRTDEKTIGTA
jgi:hypothetical protein